MDLSLLSHQFTALRLVFGRGMLSKQKHCHFYFHKESQGVWLLSDVFRLLLCTPIKVSKDNECLSAFTQPNIGSGGRWDRPLW